MTKVTCILIEDEKPAQEVLVRYIEKTDWLSLIGTFEDAITAMDFLKRNEVDLIFLDIQIPGLTGIEFLKALPRLPQVIITTAYSEYALDAFDLDVRDYLKKPFSFDRFLKAVNRISLKPDPLQVHQIEQATAQSFAFFNVNKTMVKVDFNDIRYIESMREYIYIHRQADKVVTRMGIGEIEKLLGAEFLRIHRSFIVNVNKITAFNAEEILIEKTSLPIGTVYKKIVTSKLDQLSISGA